MPPTEQKALFLLTPGGEFAVRSRSVPSPGAGEILARVDATALNPVDWKIHRHAPDIIQYPGILGTDGAGVVEEVGEGVTHLQKGDRILWQGMFTNDRATFQQYTLATAYHVAKLPDSVSVDEAASVPLGLATAFLGLYNEKKDGQGGGAGLIPYYKSTKAHEGSPIVVLGGATSVGQYAIQFARLSGFSPIIATASVKHTEFLKSLGATHVLSRTLPDDALIAEIRSITSQPVEVVYDAVSHASTQKPGWSLLAPGGQLVLVLPPAEGIVSGQDGKGVVNVVGNVGYPGQVEIGRELYATLSQLLADGSIKPNRVQLLPEGLAGIPHGLDLMRQEQVSGNKLVVRPQETA
ncbi:GroES-like protein [Punctularia strigosozonata HHB-11173 SS5]|uniref:GroES-like protein n=1 Tax=Punctularia strigosozonata (strain HHB-11173) TaxID=741275 RepID=UPI0004418689|nr:GroES-like protein [Punctularia strigosozonata HHB-11173 SS5]EIN10099.1 GroES-like protein [Punctularia strigosozonata HHB-11173 SS5]